MKNKLHLCKRAWSNNCFILKLINQASPFLIPFLTIFSVVRGINSFFMTTLLYQYVLNALQSGKKISQIVLCVCGMFAFMLIYAIMLHFKMVFVEIESCKIDKYIQRLLQDKAITIDIACYENPKFYDLYIKVLDETTKRAMKVLNDLCEAVVVAITIISVGSLIVSINPIFIVLAIAPMVSTLLFGEKYNTVKYEEFSKEKEIGREKDYVRRVFFLADYSKEIRLSEMYKPMLNRMSSSISKLKEITHQYGYRLLWMELFLTLIFDVIVYFGSIIIAAYKSLVELSLRLGDCFVVINSISNIAYSFNSIGDLLVAFNDNSRYIENLRAYLEYEEAISENPKGYCAGIHEVIQLKNVSFSYDGGLNFALKNINMTINAGEKIAIVGYNGSGKTTLIKLLLRFYEPTNGVIEYNGHNIADYRLSSYRNIYGTLFQDYHLFAVSIAENIVSCGNLSNEQKIKAAEALKKVGGYNKIQQLPHGISTIVTKEFDQNGAIFSGGEEQKIALARAIEKEPEIVILDEPSSALDPISEDNMYRNVFDIFHNKTIIFITHRLSSTTMADKIFLFDNGEIVEQGTHKELLRKRGKFAQMWHKQADRYVGKEL